MIDKKDKTALVKQVVTWK